MLQAIVSSGFVYLLLSIPIILVIRFVSWRRMKKRGHYTSVLHEISVFFLFLLVAFVIAATVIPRFELTPGGELQLLSGVRPTMNWYPFHFINELLSSPEFIVKFIFADIIGNLLTFAAIGFAIPLLWEIGNPIPKLIGYLGIGSILIELLQILQGRIFDIDDVIVRLIGAAVGVFLFALLNKYAPNVCIKFKRNNYKISGRYATCLKN